MMKSALEVITKKMLNGIWGRAAQQLMLTCRSRAPRRFFGELADLTCAWSAYGSASTFDGLLRRLLLSSHWFLLFVVVGCVDGTGASCGQFSNNELSCYVDRR